MYSVISPLIVMRPSLGPTITPVPLMWYSVKHIAPSGPAAIAFGFSCREIPAEYSVTLPVVVIRPIAAVLRFFCSVNQSAPSGPAAIEPGAATALKPFENRVTLPVVVMRPIAEGLRSVNHSALSGPAAIHRGAESVKLPPFWMCRPG